MAYCLNSSGGEEPDGHKIKMNTQTIKSLKAAHKTNWLAFTAKAEKVLTVMGDRMNVKWSATEDITEHVTAADFVAAGFSSEEAEAMMFVLTQDCMGQAVNSTEMVDRWFCYCL